MHPSFTFKRIRLSALAIILITVSSHLSAQDDILKLALQKIGRDSSNIGFKPQSTWGIANLHDDFRLPYFDDLLASPLKIPLFTKDMIGRYDAYILNDTNAIGPYKRRQVRTLASLVMNSAKNLGIEMGKYGWDYEPLGDELSTLRSQLSQPKNRKEKNDSVEIKRVNDFLLSVFRKIFERHAFATGSMIMYDLPTQPWSDQEKRIRSQLSEIPLEMQMILAEILEMIYQATPLRDESLSRIPKDRWQHIYHSTTLEESQCDAHTFDKFVYDAARDFDSPSAYLAAMKLAQVIEKNFERLASISTDKKFLLDVPTPIGRVIVSAEGNEVHYAKDCALLIDLNGDDKYYGSVGASSLETPLSVAIDVRGTDSYINEHEGIPSQGSGVMGIGILCDLAGDDQYASKTFSQGCGRFGVGILYDASGIDSYAADGFCQGAGMYGVGILFDRKGNDTYNCVYYAQGYGFARGLGLLADAEGNDQYIADDSKLTHVGDETPLHNESDAQGYGAGRRADHTDGYSMSGGIGMLSDLAGDDTYFAGVFGQGTGYWYGYGVLNDRSGNDKYRGVFFNLGSTAHFAIGVLFDDAGDDYTDLVMTCGVGMAHDGSASFYIDAKGNDTYVVSKGNDGSTSLGASLNNSFALFANVGGDDVYKPMGNSVGYATSGRRGVWSQFAATTGIFLDIGGDDTYTYRQGKNSSEWKQAPRTDIPNINAIGIDVEAGGVGFER